MAPQELLKPRYKIIADFPFNDRYPVGKIITVVTESYAISDNGYPVFYCDFEEYPAIFKRLEWWEEREPEDMPEYVKDDDGKVGRLGQKYSHNLKNCVMVNYTNGNAVVSHLDNFEPATESEYNDYIKSKQSA